MASVNDTNAVWENDTGTADNITHGRVEWNTSVGFDGFMSLAEYQSVKYVLYTIAIPVICFIGSVGSFVGAITLFRALRKDASFYNIYLFSLFTCDTLTLLYGLWTGIPAIVATFDQKLGLFLEMQRLKCHNFFQGWLFSNSSFIILIISAQRFLALTKPHTVKHIWLTKYPCRFVLSITVFNAVFSAPSLLTFDSKMLVDSASNTTILVPYRKYSFISETGFRIYAMALAFVYQFLKLTLALVFNTGIISMITKRARERTCSKAKSFSAVRRRQQKMTYTTLIILTLFILLLIPRVIGTVIGLLVVDKSVGYSDIQNYYFLFWFDIYIVLSYVNCSSDVLIYIVLNSRLRKGLFQRFCFSKKDTNQPAEIATMQGDPR